MYTHPKNRFIFHFTQLPEIETLQDNEEILSPGCVNATKAEGVLANLFGSFLIRGISNVNSHEIGFPLSGNGGAMHSLDIYDTILEEVDDGRNGMDFTRNSLASRPDCHYG